MMRFASLGLVVALAGCWQRTAPGPTTPPTTQSGAGPSTGAAPWSIASAQTEPSDSSGGEQGGYSGASRARSGSYKKVSIFNGQPNCGAGNWAQERAVILDADGYYKECDIFNGQCQAPGTWYQGKAVIKDADGYYKECDIFNGKCNAPGTWFQGDAVVWCAD